MGYCPKSGLEILSGIQVDQTSFTAIFFLLQIIRWRSRFSLFSVVTVRVMHKAVQCRSLMSELSRSRSLCIEQPGRERLRLLLAKIRHIRTFRVERGSDECADER